MKGGRGDDGIEIGIGLTSAARVRSNFAAVFGDRLEKHKQVKGNEEPSEGG